MKRVTLMALVAIFTMSFSLMAQENTGRQGRRPPVEIRWTANDRAENMAKQLELTDDEKIQVEALFEKQDKERSEQIAENQAKREKARQDREVRRTEMQELREKTVAKNDAELEKIIGKEKMEQWKEYRADRQKSIRDSNRRGRRISSRGR